MADPKYAKQARHVQKLRAAGKCAVCGKPADGWYCKECGAKKSERRREARKRRAAAEVQQREESMKTSTKKSRTDGVAQSGRLPVDRHFESVAAAERKAAAARRNGSRVDPEVEEFREGFDADRIVESLGHTPNAMVGAIVDGARSAREANGNGRTKKRPHPGALPVGEGDKANGSPAGATIEVKLALLKPFEFQVRRTFDPAYIAELGASLKKVGQLQDAIVRKAGAGFELLIGECRMRAAKHAGLHTLRCRVVDVTDEEAIEIHLAENLKRRNLNPIEEAHGLKLLIDKCGYTQEALARRFKEEAAKAPKGEKTGPQSQGAVSSVLGLLELPPELQDLVASGKLPTSHAIALRPHARRPAFAKAFAKEAKRKQFQIAPLRRFDDQIVETYWGIAERACGWDSEGMKILKAHREELDVEPGPHGDFFVFNRPLWKKLVQEERDRAVERMPALGKPKKGTPAA